MMIFAGLTMFVNIFEQILTIIFLALGIICFIKYLKKH